MPGGVDQVEHVVLAIAGAIGKPNGLCLDRYPPLPFQIHGVEHLFTHVPLADRAGQLQEAVGQGRLAMVDVGNDGEVANARLIGHG